MGRALPTLRARAAPLAEAARQREMLNRVPIARDFDGALAGLGLAAVRATGTEVLQINIGKRCNQTCRHCHVDAGPDRDEVMSRETMERCVEALARSSIPTVDITGGAPE